MTNLLGWAPVGCWEDCTRSGSSVRDPPWPSIFHGPCTTCRFVLSDASCIMMAYASVMSCVPITSQASRLSVTVRGHARLTRPGAYPPGHQPPRFTPCFTPRFTPRASCRVACAAVPRGRRRALGPLRAASRCGSRAGCAAAGRRPARDTARRVQPHVPMAVSDDPTIRVRLPISDDSVAHVSVTASVMLRRPWPRVPQSDP